MKKKLILSSILSIVMCFSLICGATFALFTSEDKVNIAVTSGTVSVMATATKTAQGSTLGVNNDELVVTDNQDGTFDIAYMIPNDYVEFKIAVTSASNVDMKFRIATKFSGELAPALALAITDEDGNVLSNNFFTKWELVDANTVDVGVYTVKITFPEREDNNDFMNKSAEIEFKVEAVQGNADVVDPVLAENAEELSDALDNAKPGQIIDASGVETNMSTLGVPDGNYTVLDLNAGTSIKGLTLSFGSNQPIKTNNGTQTTGEIVFENCTFLSSGFVDSVYFQSGTDAAGTKLVFNNCTFAAAKVVVADNSGGGVEFNNCKFNLNDSGYGLIQCMGGNQVFNSCEFNISASKSMGSSPITKYGQLNLFSYRYNTNVTLNQCVGVPSVFRYAENGVNTFINNP